MCHIRDRHRHPGQCDLSLEGGDRLRAPHPPAAESPRSGSYLNRSLRRTHDQHSTETMARPPEVMSSLDCPQVQFSKMLLASFPHILTLGFRYLALFLKTGLSSQSSCETSGPRGHQLLLEVFLWSFGSDFLVFL